MVEAGDDLAALIEERPDAASWRCAPGDVLVLAQKIVSKAEGRMRRARDRHAVGSARSSWRAEVQKDPRLVELILSESVRVVRSRPERADRRAPAAASSWPMPASTSRTSRRTDGVERALLLPVDPDGSAEALRARLGVATAAA